MKYRGIIGFLLCFALLFIYLAFISFSYAGPFGRGNLDFISGPTLLSPTTKDIDLSGKVALEFRWEEANTYKTDYLDFRLYKGYDTYASNLILKQRFPVSEYPIKVPASVFEIGQVYTWVIVQVFIGGSKSDKSSSSFKIIKK